MSSKPGSTGASSGVTRNQSNAAAWFAASTSPAATGPSLAPALSGPLPIGVNAEPSSEYDAVSCDPSLVSRTQTVVPAPAGTGTLLP